MKHLVLISGSVYPNPSPTGRVFMEYVEPLLENYRISIVYMSDTLHDNTPHYWRGYHLYPRCNWRMRIEQRFSQGQGVLAKGMVTLAKMIGRVQTRLFMPNNLRWFWKSASRALETINTKYPIDAIFSVSSPFAAHMAAHEYKSKHPSVKWLSYTVDPYSSTMHLFPIGVNLQKATKFELRQLETANVRFMSEELIANRRDLSDNLKFEALPYLLPFEKAGDGSNSNAGIEFDESKVVMVYAGSFYVKDRNPGVMLKTIYELRHNAIELHVFSSGACVDMVQHYAALPESNIFFHGKVTRETLLGVYKKADILVNIANRNPESSPSKIFEYIMLRKPIIEFSNITKSGYLVQYPKSLVLSDNDDRMAEKVLSFSKSNKGVEVDIEELEHIYQKHLRANITNLIMKNIES